MRFLAAIFFACVVAATSHAQLIRDTEIENALRVYTHPLLSHADLHADSVRLHIVKDDSLNAFVAGGQRIFIHSGTIIAAESVEELLAVIAHEIGHIAGGHLAGLQAESRHAGRNALLSVLVGVPLLLSGNPDAAIGVGLLGPQVAKGQLLNYTQTMESSADAAALRYLMAEGITAEGMLAFLRRLRQLEKIYGEPPPYLRSHPLTRERIAVAESAILKEGDVMTPQIITFLHARIRGKLIGHLWEPTRVLQTYPKSDNSVTGRYARAFSYMRRGLFDSAHAEIDSLLAKYPGDVFFLEAKGDIYYNAGRMADARDYYGQALQQVPWAALIHARLADSLSDDELADAELVAEALQHVAEALRLEPRLYPAWRAKGVLEAALGNDIAVDLANAEVALLRGDLRRAEFLARRVEESTGGGSDHIQALDIIARVALLKNDN